MTMSKGSVTIDSETGAASGSGAAYDVFQALDGDIDYQGLSGSSLAAARQQIANIASAVSVIIDHIKNNASVSVTTTGTASSVQTGSGTAPTSSSGTGTVS